MARKDDQFDEDEEYEERTLGDTVSSVGASIGYALVYVIMVIGISVILACVGWILANDVLALNKVEQTVEITIGEGESFDTIAQRLKDEGLIDYQIAFDLFATVTKSKEKISPGTYTVDTDMDYNALIRNLGQNSATKAEVQVTIPEGYTVDQIFALLEEKGVATVESLKETAATHDYAFGFLEDVPMGDYKRLEGYLFPDTYTFYYYHDPLWVINKMLVNFYNRMNASVLADIEEIGYTMHEVLTIASMIERETDGTDRDRIASVIYNRMHNPSFETMGRLQIDATIYYLTGREVTQNDRENIDSPFNTHINAGLPPRAICNPGMASIQAALNPAGENFYYYALGDDELHHFCRSYSELTSFIASQNRYN